MEKLTAIQTELKVPKGQFNSFGKYNYRSCEDIMEAIKPVLKKHNCSLIITDDVVEISGRIYVKATVKFGDGENAITTTAFAREPEDKKGMDASQITGAASSYARKYALAGMFLLDDTKDADATSNGEEKKKPHVSEKITPPKRVGLTKEAVMRRLSMCKSEETLKAIWAETIDRDDQDIRDAFKARGEIIKNQSQTTKTEVL